MTPVWGEIWQACFHKKFASLMSELSLNNFKVTLSPFLLRLLLFIKANCRWSFGPALGHAPWPFQSDQGPIRSFQARMALLNQSVTLRPALFVLFIPLCWQTRGLGLRAYLSPLPPVGRALKAVAWGAMEDEAAIHK